MVQKSPGKKTYRTANGKHIDLDLLISRNELTPAVGNMKVNARGDELGPGGKIIRPREEVLRDYYNNSVGVPDESVKPRKPEPKPEPEPEPEIKETASVRRTTRKTEIKNLPTDAELAEWEEDEDGNFVKKGEK